MSKRKSTKSRAGKLVRLVHFRDIKTGRFVKRGTWARSKAHGGTRYKRQVEEKPRPLFKLLKPPPKPPEPPGPNVGKMFTWVELMDLANEKHEASIYYSEETRTPGRVGIADWMMERRDMREALTEELGTSWQVIPMWKVDADSENALDAHAETIEEDTNEEEEEE